MFIALFNGWYFFWLLLAAGATAGLYFLLRNRSTRTQKIVLFSFLALGLLLHFLKVYIPPYSVDQARMLRDSWFVNICGANIALFPFMFFSKNEKVKDYMFYIGVLSGVIALFYPEEPMAKVDQMAEQLDIVRFYYHHWMVMAIPLLMVMLGLHKLSYKRVWAAPVGLLLLMLFILLNQLLQSELGFIPLRNAASAVPNYKNTSYIWGPLNGDGSMSAIGGIFDIFCPSCFKTLPVSCEGYGMAAGSVKYWPWFWMIVPVFVLVTPLSFLVCMIFDAKNFGSDVKKLIKRIFGKKEKVLP